jgi:neutral ceramidase
MRVDRAAITDEIYGAEVSVYPDERQKHILRAGAAQVDITPAPGIPLTGFILRQGSSTGIHDRLFAKALALEADGQQAVLIACDLLALDFPFVSSVRSSIHLATGIPEENIMITCTHTHSGPATTFLRDCGEVDVTYLESLRLWVVGAVQESISNLCQVKMGVGRGHYDVGVRNRRQPEASTDTDLGVVCFRDDSGQLQAILVNYTCHPVCMDYTNRLISADYPGYLANILQEQTHAVVLFTNGAAGDINPERVGSFTFAEDLGRGLAEETLRVLKTLEFRDEADLSITGMTLDLPLTPPPTSVELNQSISAYRHKLMEAEAAGDVLLSKLHKAMLGWAEDTLLGTLRGNLPMVVAVELQLICLGDVALVGIPGEMFCELGKEIKNWTSRHQVLVLGYTNNDIGYIPTREAYALGGYEINDAFKYYGYPAALAPEAGRLVQQSTFRLLECLPGSSK